MEKTEITKRPIERKTPPPAEFDYEVRFRGELLTDGFNEYDSEIIQKVVDHAIELERAANPSETPSNLNQKSEVQEGLGLTADYVDRQFFKAYQTVATMDGATFKGEKWLNRDEVLDYLDGLFPFGKESSPPTPEEGVRLTGEFVAKRNPDGEIEHHFISEGDADVQFAATPEAIPLTGPVEILIRFTRSVKGGSSISRTPAADLLLATIDQMEAEREGEVLAGRVIGTGFSDEFAEKHGIPRAVLEPIRLPDNFPTGPCEITIRPIKEGGE